MKFRRILRRALPPDVRESIIADLDEVFVRDSAAMGLTAARRNYRRKALSLIPRFLAERVRDRVMSLARIRVSLLDFRLGLRMLVRYPVLTIVGTGSLALAIALGAAAFAFITLILWPRLPLPEGDRIVAIAVRDEGANQGESRITADFLRWRAGTETLTDIAAGRSQGRNLTTADGLIQPVTVAEVTASTFAMTRVPTLMGRHFNENDANAAAPPVMIIGERIWRDRFRADPEIVGKSLMMNDAPVAVVGVMPAEYRFPSIYEVWQPLKLDETVAPRSGIGLRVFGRLKPGVTVEQANAELAVLSAQSASDWPATHARLKAVIAPVAYSEVNDPAERTLMAYLRFGVCLLVLLVSGNVALLMFARAATRESELIVRTALGASRGRIIAQFLSEAFVLSAVAAAAGLWLAQRTMSWGVTTFTLVANDGELLPFWITPRLPPVSIAYGIGLALLATAMTGILPALKITRGLSSRLRETSAGGGGLKFGGVWTVLIVSQIAVTVFTPSMVYVLRRGIHQTQSEQIGVPAEQFLTARLGPGSGMTWDQYNGAIQRVREEMAATPGVARVILADKLPLMWNGYYEILMDEGGSAPTDPEKNNAHPMSLAAVQPDFFPAFEAPALAGRLLVPGDYAAGTPLVIVVNQSFVKNVLEGRNAVGRHIRFQRKGGDGQLLPDEKIQRWFEIVGVVRDLAMTTSGDRSGAGAYVPLNLRAVNSVRLAARVSGDMAAATNALRSIALRADRSLRLDEVQPLSRARDNQVKTLGYVAWLFGVLSASSLVLALSGIYAVMSFAVSRRTREIGIRIALGASRPRVVLAVLRRPLIQTAMGIVIGGALTLLWVASFGLTAASVLGAAGYIVVTVVVCLLAAVVPARRALKTDPIAALRVD